MFSAQRQIRNALFSSSLDAPRSGATVGISSEIREAIREDVRVIVHERLKSMSREELSEAFREARERVAR